MNKKNVTEIQPICTVLQTHYARQPSNFLQEPPYLRSEQIYKDLQGDLIEIPYMQQLVHCGKPCFLEYLLRYIHPPMKSAFLQTLLLTLIEYSNHGSHVSSHLFHWFRKEGWEFPYNPCEIQYIRDAYPVNYAISKHLTEEYDTIPCNIQQQPLKDRQSHTRNYSLEEIEYWRKRIDVFRYGDKMLW